MLGVVKLAIRQCFQHPVHRRLDRSVTLANLLNIFAAKLRWQVFGELPLVFGQFVEDCHARLWQLYLQKRGVLDEDICQSVDDIIVCFGAINDTRRISLFELVERQKSHLHAKDRS